VSKEVADSPFGNYTGYVLAYALWIGFLVITLIGGGLLILNVGMLSRRREDRLGGRTPGDLGLLKENVWPEAPYYDRALPAEEDEEKPAGDRSKDWAA
jgi:hypothetical protein